MDNEQNKTRMQSIEMKFMRYIRGCFRVDKIRNERVRSQLNMFLNNDKIEDSKTKWKDHVERIVENRIPKIMNYRSIGKRDLGRPPKKSLKEEGEENNKTS